MDNKLKIFKNKIKDKFVEDEKEAMIFMKDHLSPFSQYHDTLLILINQFEDLGKKNLNHLILKKDYLDQSIQYKNKFLQIVKHIKHSDLTSFSEYSDKKSIDEKPILNIETEGPHLSNEDNQKIKSLVNHFNNQFLIKIRTYHDDYRNSGKRENSFQILKFEWQIKQGTTIQIAEEIIETERYNPPLLSKNRQNKSYIKSIYTFDLRNISFTRMEVYDIINHKGLVHPSKYYILKLFSSNNSISKTTLGSSSDPMYISNLSCYHESETFIRGAYTALDNLLHNL